MRDACSPSAPLRSAVRAIAIGSIGSAAGSISIAIGFDAIQNATRPRWMSQCQGRRASCCAAWAAKVDRHFRVLRGQYTYASGPRYAQVSNRSRVAYDLHEPTWSCELKERVPEEPGDGPKHVCGLDTLRSQPGRRCLIYSFGSDGKVEFEAAVKARHSHCEIHTFDPFISLPIHAAELKKVQAAQQQGLLRYHNVGLVGDDHALRWKNKAMPKKTFPAIMQDIGHAGRAVDILKVDIEYSEYLAFRHAGLFGDCAANGKPPVSIGQLQVEVHGTNIREIFRLAELMHSCGFALFNKEANHWGCDGYKCVELSLVSPEQAFASYALSHPSCTARAPPARSRLRR